MNFIFEFKINLVFREMKTNIIKTFNDVMLKYNYDYGKHCFKKIIFHNFKVKGK